MLDNYLPIYFSVLILTFLLTIIIEHRLIPLLKGKADQPIYDGGPDWHLSKSGTPTMGGLAFLISALFSLALCSFFLIYIGENNFAVELLLYTSFCAGNAFIGFFDDVTKLKRKNNAGLTPLQKLFLQALIATLFLAFYSRRQATPPTLDILIIKINSFALYFPWQ